MGRKAAAELIDKLRVMIANRESPEAMERVLTAHRGRIDGVPPIPKLRACDGPAHSNAHVDNCLSCAPRWGWIGPRVVVR